MNSVTLNERTWQLFGGCSEELLTETVHALSAFHRIQATDGYRLAAKEAARRLACVGLPADIRTYPADFQTTYLTQGMFRGWRCSEGWLEITTPFCERAADYSVQEMSLIQRSASLDAAQRELPIFYAPEGVQPETFCEDMPRRTPVRGKQLRCMAGPRSSAWRLRHYHVFHSGDRTCPR